MTLLFETLATLSATHEYYDGGCEDFTYLLPSETAARPRAAHILVRSLDGVLHLLFEANEQGNPRVEPGETTVRVGLKLLNPYFSNLTATGPGLDGTKALYRNAEDPAELDPSRARDPSRLDAGASAPTRHPAGDCRAPRRRQRRHRRQDPGGWRRGGRLSCST